MFDFNDSLNDVAPVSPMLLSVDKRKRKEGFADGYLLCVFFCLPSHIRLSSMSVVFDFNASPNDVAPVSPISLTVGV